MNNIRPNLSDYFYALDTFLIGDIQVFEKNCEVADKAESFYHPRPNTRLEELLEQSPPPYSSIYDSPSSHVMAAYLENPNPRLTIPLALTLFSAMELLGIFYTGLFNGRSTTNNIRRFLSKVSRDRQPTDAEATRLIKTYRHGLAHQYFAKGESSLSYSHLSPDKLFFGENSKFLNVNYLIMIFLNGYYAIRNDEANFTIMENNLQKMVSKDKQF